MFVIVDVQGFKTSGKEFTPKELAAYDGMTISHYIFKAPFSFATLPHHLQQQATWVMHNHHCIHWNEGHTPVFLFAKIFQRIVRDVDVIYVKGTEKTQFLKTYTNKHIIEIEEHPALTPSKPACIYHMKSICFCALSNVYHLYQHYVMQ